MTYIKDGNVAKIIAQRSPKLYDALFTFDAIRALG